jgi:hypothetical protein
MTGAVCAGPYEWLALAALPLAALSGILKEWLTGALGG